MTVVTKYATVATPGGVAWGDPTSTFTVANLNSDNAVYASCACSNSHRDYERYGDSGYLSGFGFAIPSNAVITAVRHVWEAKCVAADGSIKQRTYNAWAGYDYQTAMGTTPTVFHADWVGLPTVAEINGSGWQVVIAGHSERDMGDLWYVDYFYVEATYYVPPIVTTAAITAYDGGAQTATCGGEVTSIGDSAVTARGCCWNLTGSPTTADSKTTNGSGIGSFTSALTGLAPGSVWYVRAYATNGGATSYGNEQVLGTVTNFSGGLGRITMWPRCLTTSDILTDVSAGETVFSRSRAKGTVVISGMCHNRKGARVPAHHIRAGRWIQNLDWQPDPAKPPPTLYITGHSVDLAGKKNGLTIGVDWMEQEIGVRKAELLATPPSVSAEVLAEEMVVPDNPGTSDTADTSSGDHVYDPRYDTLPSESRAYTGPGTTAAAPAGYQWTNMGDARVQNLDGEWSDWANQGWTLQPSTTTPTPTRRTYIDPNEYD